MILSLCANAMHNLASKFFLFAVMLVPSGLLAQTTGVVNDTIWTKRVSVTPTGLFGGSGMALVPGENAFLIPRYDPNEDNEELKYSIGKFSLETGEEIEHIPTPNYYHSLTLSADSSMYVGGNDKIYFLDAQTLNVIREVQIPPYVDENGDTTFLRGLFSTRKSNFQNFIKIYTHDHFNEIEILKIYNFQTDSFVKDLPYNSKTTFSPDESLFVTATSQGCYVTIYNTADWSVYDEFKMEVDEEATTRDAQTLSFSPDGTEICFVVNTSKYKETQELKFYNVASKQITKTIKVNDLFSEEEHYFERMHYMDDDYIMFGKTSSDHPVNFIFSNLENNLVSYPQNTLGNCYRLFRTNISTYYLYGSTYVQRFDFRPDLLSSVEENPEQTLYPNPTTGNLTYQFSSSEPGLLNWQIVDLQSQVMLANSQHFPQGENNLQINISSLPVGTYFLNLSGVVSGTIQIKLQK